MLMKAAIKSDRPGVRSGYQVGAGSMFHLGGLDEENFQMAEHAQRREREKKKELRSAATNSNHDYTCASKSIIA